MKRTYQFRIYPNRKQEASLQRTLELARLTYNHQLALKIKAYNEQKINLSQFDLNNALISLKEEYPLLKTLHSQVLQDINKRIHFAFNNFFRRVKNNEQAGFPRFKSRNRYHSMHYPQSGFALLDQKKIFLSKIGNIKIKQHREIRGNIKTLTIKKTSTNKWFASFSVEEEERTGMPHQDHSVGIDLGLHHFLANSNGDIMDNPRYLRRSEEMLMQRSRKHSRKQKGSKNRNKSRLQLASIHERIRNQRKDFLHKQSRSLANQYANIAIEKLKIKNLQQNKYLAKSIADASWRNFLQMLSYKVEETGGKLIEVNPKGTSQYCLCGNKVEKTLAQRIHYCAQCGIIIDRDVMSAKLIHALAFEGATLGTRGSNAWGNVSAETSMNQETRRWLVRESALAIDAQWL